MEQSKPDLYLFKVMCIHCEELSCGTPRHKIADAKG